MNLVIWIAIGMLIVLAFFFFKFEHQGRRVKFIAILIIAILLYFSIISVLGSSGIDLKSPKGIVNAVYMYVGWMGKTVTGLWDVGKSTVSLVGNVIKGNQTSSEEQG